MSDLETIRQKFATVRPFLDERARRIWAAAEAAALGYGGISLVARATGLARSTIYEARRDLQALPPAPDPASASAGEAPAPGGPGSAGGGPSKRLRRPGGGRKRLEVADPTLTAALEALVDPLARGDPESLLRWTTKSTTKLAAALHAQGHSVSAWKVGQLLKDLGYSLQGTRKTRDGKGHPDRDAQFRYINDQAAVFQAEGQPVLSVDTKKKELVGPFANGGREWQPTGCPEAVRTHDFPDRERGKAIPYGVYDRGANEAWVSVGTDHDTAEFAVATIRQWWQRLGRTRYPNATRLLITADGGGSNGSRVRLWKVALQALADETGLAISVCHYPPGTSKWNQIEHRLFGQISINWRGRPLTSHEVMVELIANTRTRTGLRVQAAVDAGKYPLGQQVSAAELEALALQRAEFHGEWNYTLLPRIVDL
jgi:hypothetical protein